MAKRLVIKDKYKGILFIIMAGFFFSLMTFFVRLSGDLPTMQKAFFRNAVAAVVAIAMLMRTEEKFKIKKSSWPGIAARSICGTTGLICNFYAIDKLNIADANILNKLSPFFAIIASYFVLKERANRVEWASVVLAFAGALFVVKPSFHMDFLYAMVGVAGGLGAGIAYTYVRKLGKQGGARAGHSHVFLCILMSGDASIYHIGPRTYDMAADCVPALCRTCGGWWTVQYNRSIPEGSSQGDIGI